MGEYLACQIDIFIDLREIGMRNFLETNTVTHNLMSFSGFKAMLIFSMLVQSPKTYEELKRALENNEYLKETVSIDTIRIYMNSLKKIGCNIKKNYEGRTVKYYIDSHPFELKITDKQVDSIIKVYNAIAKSIEISDFLVLNDFFNKILPYISNEDLKLKLKNLSPINNINYNLILELMEYTENNTEITILYNAKNSGKKKQIDILADKMNVINGKLYLMGYNSEYQNYAEFLVSNIIKIVSVNLQSPKLTSPEYTVRYEYFKEDNSIFEPMEIETIEEETESHIIVKIKTRNKFIIMQRILSHSNKCKVISPENYKQEIISILKSMKEGYIEK